MKRAFLWGFASILSFAAVVGWIEMGIHTWLDIPSRSVSIIASVAASFLAVVFFWAARRCPPNRSFGYAVGGWVLAFVTFLVCGSAFTFIYNYIFPVKIPVELCESIRQDGLFPAPGTCDNAN